MLKNVLRTSITYAGVISAENCINGELQNITYEKGYRSVFNDAGNPLCYSSKPLGNSCLLPRICRERYFEGTAHTGITF